MLHEKGQMNTGTPLLGINLMMILLRQEVRQKVEMDILNARLERVMQKGMACQNSLISIQFKKNLKPRAQPENLCIRYELRACLFIVSVINNSCVLHSGR
jgi:hypothetical protein